MLAKLITFVLWLCVGIIAVLVSGYLVLLAINWQDEGASPEALMLQSLIENQPHTAPELNGYQYLLQQSHQLTATHSALLTHLFSPCHEDTCHDTLVTQQSELAILLEQEQAILAFYDTLLRFSHWQEDLPLSTTTAPSYSVLHYAHRLYLAKVWLLTQQGDVNMAQTLLQHDYLFWRNALANNRSLLSHAVTHSALTTHLQFVEGLLRRLTPEQQHVLTRNSWQTPFATETHSLEHVYAGEWVNIKSVSEPAASLNEMTENASIAAKLIEQLIKPLWQQQATLNELASRILSCTRQHEKPQQNSLNWLYNPIGKLLNANAPFDCDLRPLHALEQQRLRLLASYAG